MERERQASNQSAVCNRVRFFYNNYLDLAATVQTYATQNDSFPASNVENAQRTRIYRTGATVAAEYLKWDLGSAKTPTHLIILDHTILATATLGIDRNTTDSFPAASGAVTWTTSYIFHAIASPTSKQWWKLLITKASSAETFDIGRMFLGVAVTLTDKVDFGGFTKEIVDLSVTQKSVGGQSYTDQRDQYRMFKLRFSRIPQADADAITTLFETVGTHTPFFMQIDEDLSGEFIEPLYVKFAKAPKFQDSAFDSGFYYDTAIEVEELL
jgi:hypothetical protein